MKFILISIISSLYIFSQSIYIESVNTDNLPNTSARIYTFTDQSEPAQSLTINDFQILDSQGDIPVVNYSTPNQNLYGEKTLLYYIDLNLFENYQEEIKNLLAESIAEFDNSNTRIIVIGFDQLNYLYFDSDFHQINIDDMLKLFESEYYSNVFEALDFNYFNPIDYLIDLESETKQIAILSNNLLQVDATLELSQKAIDNNIQIHTFQFGDYENQSLKSLSNQTNGLNYFGKNFELAKNLVVSKFKGYEPSNIEWEISGACESIHSGTLSYNFLNGFDTFDYEISDDLKPRLEFSPSEIELKNIVPFTNVDPIEITITAINSDITIYDVSLEADYGEVFSISDSIQEGEPGWPVTINEGNSWGTRLTYKPKDSSIVFTRIIIESDACFGEEIKILGGFPNVAPDEPTIKLLKPECGETLFSGTEYDVEWTGLLPEDIIQLEYSTNNGINWDTLAKNVNGLEYTWQVPDVDTDEALVRAIQLWPNNIGKTRDLFHLNDDQSLVPVNTAFFNNTGDYVVTTSNDKDRSIFVIKIWETSQDNLVGEFLEHTAEVMWATFSPDGEYVASVGRDGRALLWYANPDNPNFGEIAVEYFGHTDEIYSINFSPNGAQVITACKDGFFRIFDTSTGNLLFDDSNTDDTEVRFGLFAPDGQSYFVGGRLGVTYQYDRSNVIIKTFDLRSSTTPRRLDHLAVSPDNKLLAVSSLILKECRVFDIETGEVKYRLYQDPWLGGDENYDEREAIVSANFFYNDTDSLLLTSAGFEALRWDMTTGDSTAVFSEHDPEAKIRTASYDFTGDRVVTASWDGTAKIWNLTERDLQMDTTDCVFSIKSIDAIGNNITFTNEVVPGKSDVLSIQNIIEKTSSSSFYVVNAEIIGANRNSFKLNTNLVGQPLNDENFNTDIMFIPQNEGLNTAILEIEIPTKKIQINLSGNGKSENFENIQKVIDLGELEEGDIGEVFNEELWRQISNENVVVDSIKLITPYPEKFAFSDLSHNNGNITQNTVITSSFRYFPSQKMEDNAAFKIYHNGSYKADKVLIYGKGKPLIIDSVAFRIANFEGRAGETVKTQIILENITDEGIQAKITGFNFNINFNASLLVPKFNADFDSVGIYNRYMSFSLPFDIDSDYKDGDILRELEFVATLGNDSTSAINIETITQIGEGSLELDYNEQNPAIFRLLDLCYEGGARLVETYGQFRLEQNFPNPAKNITNIDIEVIEEGQTLLLIYDQNGNLIDKVLDEFLEPGEYRIPINTSTYSAGNYFYILETPSLRKSKRMLINN